MNAQVHCRPLFELLLELGELIFQTHDLMDRTLTSRRR
jgi:hypothetical protein